jgi:hypothetical protein
MTQMTVARQAPPEADLRRAPTAPLRVYSFDHQPARLLAEIEGVTVAELLHRALQEYMEHHKGELGALHRATQRHIASGDLDGLASLLGEARRQGTKSVDSYG